jgi:two-component system sensor histidine kinase FlrB
MGEASWTDEDAPPPSHSLDIASVEAPIALCTASGNLVAATASALSLLRRSSALKRLPARLPGELWRLLERSAIGEAVEWWDPAAGREVLGCTRYRAAGGYLLLMKEVSSKRRELSERLNRQQADSTERLVASIAHDIRSSVASVVYSADFLNVSGVDIAPGMLSEAVRDISKASLNLQRTVDALLDYARLGPSVSVSVSLRDALNRASSSLRTHYREGAHRLRVDLAPNAELVRGNPIVIEQIFIHLLLNAVEASDGPCCVIVTAFPAERAGAAPDEAQRICIRVWDDGPGISREARELVFEPFFTTKPGNVGLGLAVARRAAESLEGSLELTDDANGTCFALYLPAAEATP